MNFENILEIPLTFIKQTSLIHNIYRVPDRNWYSRCLKLGRKAAELKRTKLQSEIQKEKSELQRKKLEKQVKMASSRGTKGGRMKSPKQEDDDDDFLEDLVVDSDPKKPKKLATYLTLKPGGLSRRLRIAKGGWKNDRQKLKQQNNKTMTMMTMMRKPKRNSWKEKPEN